MPLQRLVQQASGTSDANGLLSVALPTVAAGLVWTGSIAVPGAPTGALFTVSLNALPIGSWGGAQALGSVQAWSGETLTVVGSGLTPNTAYTVNWLGISQAAEQAVPVFPAANTPPFGPGVGIPLIDLPVGSNLAFGQTIFGPFNVTNYAALAVIGWSPTTNPEGVRVTLQFSPTQDFKSVTASLSWQSRNQTGTQCVIEDYTPIFGAWCRVLIDTSNNIVVNTGKIVPLPELPQAHSDFTGPVTLTPMSELVVAGGALAAGVTLTTLQPGPWQVTVFVGTHGGAGVAGIPWTLEIDEAYYNGGSAPIAVLSNDALTPAGAASPTSIGVTEIIRMSYATPRFFLTNHAAGAQSFSISAMPVPA